MDSGVEHGKLLSKLVETTLQPDQHEPDEASNVRQAICTDMSAQALVDASAIIGNFQRMVRIADGTGIPLDKPVAVISAGLREQLGYNQFGSAKLTPKVGWLLQWLGERFRPLVIKRLAKNR